MGVALKYTSLAVVFMPHIKSRSKKVIITAEEEQFASINVYLQVEGKFKPWKLSDCVFSVVKCLTVTTLIVDTYLHVKLNFLFKHKLCTSFTIVGGGGNTFVQITFPAISTEI